VVLASGEAAVADACTNTDLFWALRGGGGGTFAIVTAVHYRLHPITTDTNSHGIVHYQLQWTSTTCGPITPDACNADELDAINAWIGYWIDVSPTLDRRWGGYWSGLEAELFFVGGLSDAQSTFINALDAAVASLPAAQRQYFATATTGYPSYQAYRQASCDGRQSWDAATEARHGASCDRFGAQDSLADTWNTGFDHFTWLVPLASVTNDQNTVKGLLRTHWPGILPINYFLGGDIRCDTNPAALIHRVSHALHHRPQVLSTM
jgi:hypothetical protein